MSKPNVILILADDMGYGDMSRHNGGLSETPVLDAFAENSICFSQHYAASPVCNPSRACLLTGRYAHRTGSIDTYDHLGGERISVRERTMADVFKYNGYATSLVGKWHNGTIGAEYHPNRRGFDEFFGFRGGWQYYFEPRLERNGQVLRPTGKYVTDVYTDEAIDFVTRKQKEPFFLHLAYNCPHFPLEAPESDIAPFCGKGFTPAVETLYAMLRNMDRNIGRLFTALQQLGLEENTIVLFSSDNGPDFNGQGEHALRRFNSQLNGHKGLVYEGGIRVPMMLRWPAGLPQSSAIDAMIHMSDWMPTLLQMTGAQLPPDHLPLDGRDIAGLLAGETGDHNPSRFWQFNRYYPYMASNVAMRDGPWKLIYPRAPQTYRSEDGELDVKLKQDPDFLSEIMSVAPRAEFEYGPPLAPELYNLDQDPGETQNLADQEQPRLQSMLQSLQTWFEDVEADRCRCPDAVFVD